VFSPLYREVSGIAGIGVGYAPSWKNAAHANSAAAGTNSTAASAAPVGNGDISREETLAVITKRLAERRAADMAQGVSLSGPHRDKYLYVRSESAAEFSLNASTGQRRLLALLLRIAQAKGFSELTGKVPVLLLDDVLLELDGEKRRRFLSVMPDYEQAFFTFLPEEPYKNYSKSATLIYHVKGGVIEKSR
jgi:DNA replication and repair protein RecF